MVSGFSLRKFCSAAFSFGVIQAAQMVLPFLAFPVLARVLGLESFGVLLYMLTLSSFLCLFVEWGFLHWGTREIAARRQDIAYCGAVFRAVLDAKFLLAAMAVLCTGALFPVVPHAMENPLLYMTSVAYGIVWGFNPTWCLQGLGKGLRAAAVIEACCGVTALAVTLLFVNGAEHVLIYPLSLLLTKSAGYGWISWRLCRSLSQGGTPITGHVAAGLHALRGGLWLFVSRGASAGYTYGVTLMLGALLSAPHMALLILADKIVKAAVSLAHPVTQALFPEVCALNARSGAEAARLLRFSLALTAGTMTLAATGLAVFAPYVIHVVLGVPNPEAAAVLRAYAPVIPLLGCDFVLGIQTLVPLKQEKAMTRIHIVTALLAVPTAAAVAWAFSLEGAQYVACAIEAFVFFSYCHQVRRVMPGLLSFNPVNFR